MSDAGDPNTTPASLAARLGLEGYTLRDMFGPAGLRTQQRQRRPA